MHRFVFYLICSPKNPSISIIAMIVSFHTYPSSFNLGQEYADVVPMWPKPDLCYLEVLGILDDTLWLQKTQLDGWKRRQMFWFHGTNVDTWFLIRDNVPLFLYQARCNKLWMPRLRDKPLRMCCSSFVHNGIISCSLAIPGIRRVICFFFCPTKS